MPQANTESMSDTHFRIHLLK